MQAISIFLSIVSIILALIGLFITIVGLPGTWLIYFGILIWSVLDRFNSISLVWHIIFIFICVASIFVDNITIYFGAKKSGASWLGIVGAILGLIFGGLIGNLPGLIIGSFIGAFVFEYFFGNKEHQEAMKAGIGAVLGLIAGNLIKFIMALAMITTWWLLAR